MRHDDDQGQGRVAIPMFLSVFFIILVLSVVRSCQGADTTAITAPLEVAKTELATKLKAARVKLIDNLKREEKAAQTAGKLDLTLAIRARLAELESAVENPFEKTEAVASQPVDGSMAERQYLAETTAASTVLAKKIEYSLAQLEAKKITATKAGKIDDALGYDDVILVWKETFDAVSKGIPAEKKGWAAVELMQGLPTTIGTLAEGSSRLMNFSQPITDFDKSYLGLRYNMIRYGEAQKPSIRAITGGRVLLSCPEAVAKQVKAVEVGTSNMGGEKFILYQLQVSAGQTIVFKEQTIVFAADMVLKTR